MTDCCVILQPSGRVVLFHSTSCLPVRSHVSALSCSVINLSVCLCCESFSLSKALSHVCLQVYLSIKLSAFSPPAVCHIDKGPRYLPVVYIFIICTYTHIFIYGRTRKRWKTTWWSRLFLQLHFSPFPQGVMVVYVVTWCLLHKH